MTKKKMTFPTTLYVVIEGDAGEEWLVCDADATSLVEMGKSVRIATYSLNSVSHVSGVVEFGYDE